MQQRLAGRAHYATLGPYTSTNLAGTTQTGTTVTFWLQQEGSYIDSFHVILYENGEIEGPYDGSGKPFPPDRTPDVICRGSATSSPIAPNLPCSP